MGQTAENVARGRERSRREEMDEFAALSQQRAVASQENGFFEREITPVTTPDGTVVTKDDGPRAGTTVEKLATLKPVFRPDGTVTAGNACPLNDGAAAVVVMSDTRPTSSASSRSRGCRVSGVSALEPRDHGTRPDRGEPPGAEAGQHDDRRHRPRRDQRGVRGAGDPDRPSTSASRGRSSTCTAARSRSATRSA